MAELDLGRVIGKSAYETAKDGGYTGTEAEFNAIMAIIEKHAERHKTGGADPLTAADIGAAPAGYGLGTETGGDNVTDCDAALNPGFYVLSGDATKNHPGGNMIFSSLLVQRRYGQIYQTLINSDGMPGPLKAVRYRDNKGTWHPWEWENPPMQPGEEYRTTERYNGEAVFARLVDCEMLLNAAHKYKYFPVPGIRFIVGWSGTMFDAGSSFALPLPQVPETGLNGTVEVIVSAGANNIVVAIESSFDARDFRAYLIVKYTKELEEDE